jgi:protease-4
LRKIDTTQLRSNANLYNIKTSDDALKAKLVDGLKYEDDVRAVIQKKLKIGVKEKINFIQLADYDKAVNESGGYKKDKIAFVVAEGEIVYGKGNMGQVSSNEYVALLRKIRNDKSIKAIVLRVNSPGGSSLASELIWREVELIKKEGKQVVVSMGDVAASGGYYIAANANKILVQPNTITGSIGVFSIVPDFSSFMKSKLGVTFDRVKTSDYADLPSVTRSMSSAESAIIQQQVDRIYTDFKTRVATGRGKEMEYIDSIAQGRVWTGRKAIELGLADQVGGIEDAILVAAKAAKVSDYRVKVYPEPKNFLEMLLDKPVSDFSSRILENELGENHIIWQRVQSLKNEKGEIKAILPFEFSIR